MKGNNALFRADTVGYMRTHPIVCYHFGGGPYSTALKKCGVSSTATTCDKLLEFDLVPKTGGIISLEILGPVGTYGQTTRRGAPIVGGWIPYLGQPGSPDIQKVGRIKAASVNADYIFTYGLTGCEIVGVRKIDGLYVYHEPTEACWGTARPAYGAPEEFRESPAYNDNSGIVAGLALLKKDGMNWKLLIQTFAGTGLSGALQVIPING